jgi:hypothetical protein
LKLDETYESSSLNYWNNIQRSGFKHNADAWKLPYRSTIVWAIRQDIRKDLGISNHRTLGFLAVDSLSAGAFERDLHVDLGSVLANALFPILEIYSNIASHVQDSSGEKNA